MSAAWCWSANWRHACKNSGDDSWMPPSPWMGSSTIPQTLSSIALRNASTSLRGTKRTPSSMGSKPWRYFAWPVSASAPMVRPWKEFSSAMTMHFPRPPAGVAGSAHHLQRAFNRLGTAVGEKSAIQSRLRAQLLRQQALVLVVVKVGNVDDLRCLLANGLHDAWV